MKRFGYILSIGALLLAAAAGCATYVEEGGVKYLALSSDEQRQLVLASRFTLEQRGKQLTVAEREMIANQEPEVTIRYNGDQSGKAVIRWVGKKRSIAMHYEGDLQPESRQRMVYLVVEEPQPDVLDFTGDKPVRRSFTPSERRGQEIIRMQ